MKSLTKIVLSLAGAFVGAAIYANAATASPGDLDTKNIKSYVVKTKVEDANRQAQIKNQAVYLNSGEGDEPGTYTRHHRHRAGPRPACPNQYGRTDPYI